MIKNVKARISSLPHIPSNDWVVLHQSAYWRNTTCCTGALMGKRVDRKIQDLTTGGGGWGASDRDKRTKTFTRGKGRRDPRYLFPSFIVLGDKVMFSELLTTYRVGKTVWERSQDSYVVLWEMHWASYHIWSEVISPPIASLTVLSVPLSNRNIKLSLFWLK